MIHHDDTKEQPRPARRRRTLLASGALTAALVLTVGMVTSASADAGWNAPSDNPPTAAPRNGEDIPNVTLVEDKIGLYYGSVTASVPSSPCLEGISGTCVTQETLPSSGSNYARQMRSIVDRAKRILSAGDRRGRGPSWTNKPGHGQPALVFDVDDTLVNTYNYEVAEEYAYTPASNATWVTAEAFPAVFGMPQLVNWAQQHGYHIFFITGRPVSQFDATVGNLAKDGYRVPMSSANVFLKNTADPPSYLTCGSTCTTIQYKSQTRQHIESMGYDVIGNFGDQYSDLKGGFSRYTFKLPNPMYYLP